MNKTNKIEVKENKFVEWFKKAFRRLGIGKKQAMFDTGDMKKSENYKEPPTTAYKTEEKRNEFIQSLKNDEEKETNKDESNEINLKEKVRSKMKYTTDEEFIQNIIEEYKNKNGIFINKNDLKYIEIIPKFYIKHGYKYILDCSEKNAEDYTRNAGATFAMVDRKNERIITAVGVVDGQVNYVEGKNIKCSDGKEYNGAQMLIDYRKLEYKENEKDINEKAYFAFSKQLDKQILNENIKTNDRETIMIKE